MDDELQIQETSGASLCRTPVVGESWDIHRTTFLRWTILAAIPDT
jgi:hypothetical protein